MTQINGSISFDTEKIGREVAESLHDSFAALHASLAAVSERLQSPAVLTRAEATEALTDSTSSGRAASLAELLYTNGFAIVRLAPEPGRFGPAGNPEHHGESPAETAEERHRRWFGRDQD